MPKRSHHCVVIGAGLSGLAAAYRLTQRGWTVDIVEARDRIGGRVFTHHFDADRSLSCELGGEWIGDNHDRMRKLCHDFGLRLQKHRYSFFFADKLKPSHVYGPGRWPFNHKAKTAYDSFMRKYRNSDEIHQKFWDKYDWWSFLGDLGFTKTELLRRDLMDSTDFGETIRLTSAYVAAGEYAGSDKYDDMDWKVVGGNGLLCEEFLKRMGGAARLHKNRRVFQIHQEGHKVRVRAALVPDKKRKVRTKPGPLELMGDFCICTVPGRYLNRIRWFPALPDEKAQAADELQYCRIMKTVVLYPRRFWPKPSEGGFSVFTSGVSDFCFDSTYRQTGTNGILCSYAVGDKADDLLAQANQDPDNLVKWITNDILDATGQKPDSVCVLDSKFQAWQADEFTQGAYAFYRSGQWFTVLPLLAQPHGHVQFAGEHLSEDWQGFMEGAVETGEAAADQL
jgi:monoamine oxidase